MAARVSRRWQVQVHREPAGGHRSPENHQQARMAVKSRMLCSSRTNNGRVGRARQGSSEPQIFQRNVIRERGQRWALPRGSPNEQQFIRPGVGGQVGQYRRRSSSGRRRRGPRTVPALGPWKRSAGARPRSGAVPGGKACASGVGGSGGAWVSNVECSRRQNQSAPAPGQEGGCSSIACSGVGGGCGGGGARSPAYRGRHPRHHTRFLPRTRKASPDVNVNS